MTISNTSFDSSHAASTSGGAAIFANQIGGLSIDRSSFTNNTGSPAIIAQDSDVTITGTKFNSNDSGISTTGSGTLKLTNVSITGCIMGSAINTSQSLVVADSKFDSNAEGIVSAAGTQVTNTSFSNSTDSAVRLNGCNPVTVSGCTFTGNSGVTGGAIVAQGTDCGQPLKISDSTFTSNSATTGNGGAIEINSGPWQLTGNIFASNSAAASGGAISNEAATGTGLPVLTNNLFFGNSAGLDGGGIYVAAPTSLHASTLTANMAAAGGGLYAQLGAVTITDTIITGNADSAIGAASGDDLAVNNTSAVTITIDYCDMEDGSGKIADPGHKVNGTGFVSGMHHNTNLPPLFVSGPKGAYYLSQTAAGQASNSPCVNAGSAPAATAGLSTRTTRTDGVGDSGMLDMGFHFQP